VVKSHLTAAGEKERQGDELSLRLRHCFKKKEGKGRSEICAQLKDLLGTAAGQGAWRCFGVLVNAWR
jgi:hypothetical protein